MAYFATRVDCVFMMCVSRERISLQNPITPNILFIQVPLRFTVICGKSTGGMNKEGYSRFCE